MEITPRKYGNRTVYRNIKIKRLIYILSIPILSEIVSAGFSLWKPAGKEWNEERSRMAQHAILRFEKHKATRQGRWKPITNGRKSNTPATPTLTPAGANTTSISSSRSRYYHFIQTVSNRPVAVQGKTAPGLWIRSLPPAQSFSRRSRQRRYKRFSRGRQTSSSGG